MTSMMTVLEVGNVISAPPIVLRTHGRFREKVMNTLQLSPGSKLKVTIGEADGEFVLSYDAHPEKGHLMITADLPDTSGRQGVIYDEQFGPGHMYEWQTKKFMNQGLEFDAMSKIAKVWSVQPPIVDDDYPRWRQTYERAVFELMQAFKNNRRK